MLQEGLYEQAVSDRLAVELRKAPSDVACQVEAVDEAEASRILTEYVSEIVRHSLDQVEGSADKRLDGQVELVNKIIGLLRDELGLEDVDAASELLGSEVAHPASLLFSVQKTHGESILLATKKLPRPETSIAHSSLFTGAIHEPHMYEELRREIPSADRIDMLVSFVMWSGLRLIIEDLRAFCERGGELRVVTTPYMGATDEKAVVELSRLPGSKVKVTYDTKSTRLHAKSYVFHRNTGFTTAYVGSSNLSRAALSSGLEWNLKIARKDQPETVDKIEATFESYWNSDEFELYDEEQRERLHRALDAERRSGKDINLESSTYYQFDVSPYPFQQRILDKLQAEREALGHWRNLVVAATGTGKTVISAFDYKRYCSQSGSRCPRLLFIAHREEILTQSINCFRGVLRDANFGDLWVGRYQPESIDHLFVSIQTLSHQDVEQLFEPDFYEFVVIDEVHHVSARTYQRVFEYVKPKVLLGLTATPERTDGVDILRYFDDRIAAELRLPEAIDDKLLCPFQYFGVSDIVDLSQLTWSRGGYDESELENVYVYSRGIAQQRVQLIADAVMKYVTDIRDVKGLGFCVSKMHAAFMAEEFSKRGIVSACLTGDSTSDERLSTRERLVKGEIRFVFVVDIYNEGVDIPEVNTLLFLRPTESLTVFLQQLGRGLRLAEGKDCCTVLDFIGQANRHYRFDQKFNAITGEHRKGLRDEVENGFVSAPRGCYIQLERMAKEYILRTITRAIGKRSWIVERLRGYSHETVAPLTLANFLDICGVDIHDLYRRGQSFSRLKVRAGLMDDFHEPDEEVLSKAFAKLAFADSRRWLRFLLDVLEDGRPGEDLRDYSELQVRMLRMLQITVWPSSFKEEAEVSFASPTGCIERIRRNPVMCSELVELLRYDLDHIDFVDEAVDLGFDCPLDLHCCYTRDQLLVAMDYLRPDNVREGVKWLPDHKIDVLMNTLNKSDRDYSPTTMYEDYSISPWLFHWQSQNKTSPESATGRRYINHESMCTQVALFVREWKQEGDISAPYTYLGLVSYQSHEGSRPMSIVWRLHRPIPSKFLRVSNKLAG